MCGEFLIQPGEVTVISGFDGFNAIDAELGYTTNAFGSSPAMIAFLQWGSTGHRWSSLAVNNGYWSNGQVANTPTDNQSTQLTINGNNALEWNLADLTLCSPNNEANPTRGPSNEAQVSISPNPVGENMLNVMLEGLEGKMMQLQIFDMNGRQLQLFISEMDNGSIEIQLPVSPAGTYFLRVVSNGRVVTERFTRF